MFVELRNVSKRFRDCQAADDISFGIEKGRLAALLGPSGSGKTTVLRMIAGLERVDSGQIFINEREVGEIPSSRRGIGFVFQNYALFRYMTVYDNIAFGLQVKEMDASAVRERVNELMQLTELSGLEGRYPNELSGGQRQRVAFARALAPNPEVLLLDEPFAAIDAKVRQELRQWLREMIHQVGITSIFVTHDHDEAVEVADQIIVMDKGRIEQEGSAREIYSSPRTAFVARFIGESVFVKDFSKLKGFKEEGYEGAIIRSEFVEAFKTDNEHFQDVLPFAQKGTICDIVFKGTSYELNLNVNGIIIPCRRSLERRPIYIGEEMNVIVYRLIAVRGSEAKLLRNLNLDLDGKSKTMEKYLYGDGGYFAV